MPLMTPTGKRTNGQIVYTCPQNPKHQRVLDSDQPAPTCLICQQEDTPQRKRGQKPHPSAPKKGTLRKDIEETFAEMGLTPHLPEGQQVFNSSHPLAYTCQTCGYEGSERLHTLRQRATREKSACKNYINHPD